MAEEPTASLVPGAAGPPDEAVEPAFVAGGGVEAGEAAACELDDELLPPQAANPAARPAVARTIPAPLLKLYKPV
jgi:hypothetical protein